MKGSIIKTAGSNIIRLGKTGLRFTRRNSNWILAGLAILGITGLSWSMIRSTIKAVKLCEEKQIQGKKEIIKTVWRIYIPAAGFFILTTLAIVGNAKINGRRLATMTGLYAMSQADLAQLKNKVKDIVGPKKEKDIETEVEKEKVRKVPVPCEEDIAKSGHGNALFIDWLTGQWFRASPDYIQLVQEKMNNAIMVEVDNIIQRSYMHRMLGLRPCGADELMWDMAEMQIKGYKEIELDCTHTEWMEVNGQMEMVCTLRCLPEAGGF